MRETRNNRKTHKKVIWITLASVLVVIALAITFFFPINNAMRDLSGGKDTVTDAALKDQLVKKVDKDKNKSSNSANDPTDDQQVKQAVTSIKKTSTQDIMQSANDESKAASILQKNTTLSAAQSRAAAKEMFSDTRYNGLRKSISSGDWYGAYNQYQTLAKNGSLDALKASINTAK
ncbi:hypothetical protein [Companilactobacillus mishanensis]|uniref:Uncharacterized protein n=1 Tax=Companilactobacillus mishanensis TaxID=2486008 RepID=A0A5P0ZIV8_9LACO|nr:hypothetical protein [Companilactobacillus mishanensis]MQS53030.1 hypothetical protein [Companilactobacillus mishanensis]